MWRVLDIVGRCGKPATGAATSLQRVPCQRSRVLAREVCQAYDLARSISESLRIHKGNSIGGCADFAARDRFSRCEAFSMVGVRHGYAREHQRCPHDLPQY